MPTRLRLSCRALLIIVLVRHDFHSAGPQASHQLNPALVNGDPYLTLTVAYDLDFQSLSSCGHDPQAYKFKNARPKVRWFRRNKPWTDGHNRLHYLTR